ncbi:MAG: (2Fe-2S)-binding protein [Planctomycetes bacterium]|nr:(2Fe-2S)-binding protein [Planctomycetota bacterium]
MSDAQRTIELEIDGRKTQVPEGATLLQACQALSIDVPTFCWAANLTPVNVCRICVVELEGARTLVPACSRKAEAGMVVKTESERVKLSRKLVLELLGSSVDMSLAPEFRSLATKYDAHPERFGPRAPRAPSGERESAHAGHHHVDDGAHAANVAQPMKVDNDLFVRDYEKCMLCYKCVEACGTDAQNTFAIAIAGRGFDARIATELETPLPDSACVFCGNCVGVCPTGALMFKAESDLRDTGAWDESKQKVTDTICPYCGVGCQLSMRVQDNKIVRVTSPADHSVTAGHLCIKGRFGWSFVEGGKPK